VEHILRALGDDGVTGIVSALATDHDVGGLGEEIDDLALAFISPLESDDDGIHLKKIRNSKH
jgi:hypothetical protein